MGRAVGAELAGLGERAGVPLVGLHPAAAGGIHGGEVSVGDDDLMAERFEVTGNPLALGAGLQEHARRGAAAEELGEALAICLDAAPDQFAVFGNNANLAGYLTQVETDAIHDCLLSRGLCRLV